MARAVWNGEVVAESDETIVVEGNHYFPPESVNAEFLRPADAQTVCHWKGTASYYDVVVGDEVSSEAAWYYPDASRKAKEIENYVAFWRGVRVES